MTDDRVEFWKSDFTADERRTMARNGQAMQDGSYPVPNEEYLGKAIQAVGRGSNNSHNAIRSHIIRRAKALGLASKIPDSWKADGTITKAEDVELRMPLWKDEERRLIYGVVLNPGDPLKKGADGRYEGEDSQGDVATPAEIEKAAHAFLTDFRVHDVQHSDQPADIVPVESFIAPCDFEVQAPDGQSQTVKKGAWVLAARVNDDDPWARVQKGELTGWSITGSAIREAILA